ncbi:addiction module antidote protein [Stutzerimonas nitrititolerans]|uniref:addiction module antidote protein n=1 Tax=Stutzerimonas nitrititolerans TaxID=2482751 RepID=UPI0026487A24|nr:addiction module antidote protein [Stutzerimonas nitrititolerans]
MKIIETNPKALKALGVRTFDLADYLQNDEDIAEYLTQVLADGDTDELIRAIGHVAKARGMSQIAKDSGLGRASLYKALAPGAQPRFDTVLKVMRALKIELHAAPSHT